MIISICPNPSVDKLLKLENLKKGRVNRCIHEEFFPGGKGVHVAYALNELHTSTKIIGFWGGPTGEWIRNESSKIGIPCHGPTIKGWNRTCLTILTPGNNDIDNTEILEKGPYADSKQLLSFFKIVEQNSTEAKAICVSGSWPENCPDDVYQTLSSICENKQIDLWVDASGERLGQAIEVNPFGIHLNKSEAEDFFSPGFTPVEYVKKIMSYCSVVALTDGANGLYLGYKGSIYHGTCQVENIISTVGSGDCLTAGLLHEWYKTEKDLSSVAKTATACGAANCIFPPLGMLRYSDVKQLIEVTNISKLL